MEAPPAELVQKAGFAGLALAVTWLLRRRRGGEATSPPPQPPSSTALAEPSEGTNRPWNSGSRATKIARAEPMEHVSVDNVYLIPVPKLEEAAGKGAQAPNQLRHTSEALQERVVYRNFKGASDCILADIVRHDGQTPESRAYIRGGPRRTLWFQPGDVRAAIVTCGGLCPGLNNIIRHIVLSLHDLYGVTSVVGVRNGYQGMTADADTLTLTPTSVATIHHHGGTMLGSSRGGFDCERIIAWLRAHDINQLYVVGGDGSQRGAQQLFEATRRKRLPISIIGVPKTIDNDIDLMDRSFGFNTAVQEAQLAIRSAKVEASCAPNGIGVVKLMGRHAGFIAAHATLASGDVDLCLIPEVPILLRGKLGCLPHLERILSRRGHAVVVVAEGAGEDLLAQECGSSCDKSGNKALPPIGPFMKDQIKSFFAERGREVTVKYIDPSYMIRSVPPNASDSLFCMLLAQNAVHGAMAGFTGFVTALCNNRVVYLPITDVVENSPRCMDPFGRTWERILSVTCQPETADTLRTGRMKRSKSFSAKTVF